MRSAEKGKVVQDAYPDHVKVVLGDLDDVETIENQSQKSDVVLREFPPLTCLKTFSLSLSLSLPISLYFSSVQYRCLPSSSHSTRTSDILVDLAWHSELADTKHMAAAHAIVKGLAWRSRTTGSKRMSYHHPTSQTST